MRIFFCTLPPIKLLHKERWSSLSDCAQLYGLKFSSNTWETLPVAILQLISSEGRQVQCARVNLIPAVHNFLVSSSASKTWPGPPDSNFIDIEDHDKIEIILLSIDSAREKSVVQRLCAWAVAIGQLDGRH